MSQKQLSHKNRDKTLGGMGVSHPQPLKFGILQGNNGGTMYFCRATYWTLDHWLTTTVTHPQNLSKLCPCIKNVY